MIQVLRYRLKVYRGLNYSFITPVAVNVLTKHLADISIDDILSYFHGPMKQICRIPSYEFEQVFGALSEIYSLGQIFMYNVYVYSCFSNLQRNLYIHHISSLFFPL